MENTTTWAIPKARKLSILLIAVAALFISCNDDATCNGKKHHCPIHVEQIDGCEYVIFSTYNSAAMVHKHNCQPCHNRKMQQTPTQNR